MDITSEMAYPTPLRNSPLLPLLLMTLATQRNAPRQSSSIKREYDYIVEPVIESYMPENVLCAWERSRISENTDDATSQRFVEKPMCFLRHEVESKEMIRLAREGLEREIYLKAIKVRLRHKCKEVCVRALMDDGFYRSYIEKSLIADLNLSPSGKEVLSQGLFGGGISPATEHGRFTQVIWPSGKGLGGSSLLNAMLYVRGNKKDYDDWEAQGAEGWSYKDVFPYFLKLEDNTNPYYLKNGYHATGGPITVENPKYNPEIRGPIYESAQELGYKVLDRMLRSRQGSIRNGQRCSTAKAYLVPAENRTNLDIIGGAYVKKILFDGSRAVGVQFDYGNSEYNVRVRQEVIMSAGTTNTAQILMLSGIGPKKHLQKLKIPVVADLPVGNNFQDHCGFPVLFTFNSRPIKEKLQDSQNIHEYVNNRTGKSKSMRKVGVKPFATIFPSFTNLLPDFILDRYLTLLAKSVVVTLSHQVGTAKMGDPRDPTTVVDPELKVKGIQGLRVVDASVMPIVPSGNTNIPTIMVAEKASDIIKDSMPCRTRYSS
ncbi:Glucose dehydrogenase like protein [Argiope bruennichi]|uniref:Glucose dehydrogenase like protein n=1 Tax=Argiope bruennichi TaxID=94029 RepID=A0A8T0F133_ARGBR|nr:Glucose dehydrogenase like protein [Argiope bruennichi]